MELSWPDVYFVIGSESESPFTCRDVACATADMPASSKISQQLLTAFRGVFFVDNLPPACTFRHQSGRSLRLMLLYMLGQSPYG